MIGVLHFTTLVITTMFAAGAAFLMNWLLLRATFQLMLPATAHQGTNGGATKNSPRLSVVAGKTRVARAYAARR